MLIEASAEAVARRAPSGLNFAQVMPRACAWRSENRGRKSSFAFRRELGGDCELRGEYEGRRDRDWGVYSALGLRALR